MEKSIMDTIETPCIVIDVSRAKNNITEMQRIADANNCKLRPHIKTHKIGLFAKLQLEEGAQGITCAKVSEAEVMAAEGIDDIFIAYPLVGDFRIKRAIRLAKNLERLILAVDSIEGAMALNEGARKAGVSLEVRLEVDTGAKRTGVVRENVADIAMEINNMTNLNLTGIYTFKSLIYEGKATQDRDAAGFEEGHLMGKIADELRSQGIDIVDISAGSTPTAESVAKTGLVTEIRPGTYIFKDYMLYKQKVTGLEDIAAHIYATVVSTPRDDYAIIDGGTKTFPMDIQLNQPPYYYPSYGVIEGNDDLVLDRMNEEHGIITSRRGQTGLIVGQKLKVIPIHICPAINMQNHVYLYDGHDVIKQKVDARGMLV